MKTKSLYPYVVVEDMEKSLKFYENLGFTVKHDAVRLDGGHVYILTNAAGFDLELMEKLSSGSAPLNPGDSGLRMNVDDIEATSCELKENGWKAKGDIIETKLGKNLFLSDPDGISITLIQHIKQ